VAIRNDGSIWTWGLNAYGQIGSGTTTQEYYSPVQVINGTAGMVTVDAGGSIAGAAADLIMHQDQ